MLSAKKRCRRSRSPKTEHHAGKGERLVPLLPELRSVLMEAFESAPDGAERVVSGYFPADAAVDYWQDEVSEE